MAPQKGRGAGAAARGSGPRPAERRQRRWQRAALCWSGECSGSRGAMQPCAAHKSSSSLCVSAWGTQEGEGSSREGEGSRQLCIIYTCPCLHTVLVCLQWGANWPGCPSGLEGATAKSPRSRSTTIAWRHAAHVRHRMRVQTAAGRVRDATENPKPGGERLCHGIDALMPASCSLRKVVMHLSNVQGRPHAQPASTTTREGGGGRVAGTPRPPPPVARTPPADRPRPPPPPTHASPHEAPALSCLARRAVPQQAQRPGNGFRRRC